MSDDAAAPLLKAENVCKSFGAVRALDDVSLTVAAGEVHGLLGANGAGQVHADRHPLGRGSPRQRPAERCAAATCRSARWQTRAEPASSSSTRS